MEVKIKRLHPKAVIPVYAKDGDAGLDLTATSRGYDEYGNIVYGTGLAFEIPEGHYGQIQPRSSITKYDLHMLNTPAIVDSGYRGEVLVKFRPAPRFDKIDGFEFGTRLYNIGDRIAQMIIMPCPHIDFAEVDELSQTERGDGGYGSTGN
ncbi:MAG: dUTP diphosphatase [Lachnospiraceae bacterium]|nr:dUTP diphosphatase [Lachnospiraceae bacterium]